VAQESCDSATPGGHLPAPTSQKSGSTGQSVCYNSAPAPPWSSSKSSPFLLIVHGYTALWRLLGTGSTSAIFPVYISPIFVRTPGAWSLRLSGLSLFALRQWSSPSLVLYSRHRSQVAGKLPFDCIYFHWKAFPDPITMKRGHDPLILV
jgi:hypothetical protein